MQMCNLDRSSLTNIYAQYFPHFYISRMVLWSEPCVRLVRARSPRLVGHVTDSSVFSRDITQASHQSLLSLRWRWLSLTRQRAPLQDGATPLHGAAYRGHEEAIGVLLAVGADQEAKDNVSGDRDG